MLILEQPQRTGAGDGFGAALYLKLVEDSAIVPFDRIQRKDELCCDLLIREALGDQA